MQRQAQTVNDFTVTSAMSKSVIGDQIAAAEQYFNARVVAYSPIKCSVITLCLKYAKDSLYSYISKDESRYTIYSNLVNFADYFPNDLHYLAFVIKQIECIPRHVNSSLRSTVLPSAKSGLATLIAPEVARHRNTFISIAVCGMGMLFVDPRIASVLMTVGTVATVCSEYITYARLNTSMEMKMHRYLSGGANNIATFDDGMEDAFGRIRSASQDMMNSTFMIMGNLGARLHRVARLGQAQPLPRVEVIEDNQLDHAALLAAASAPPLAYLEEDDQKRQVPLKKLAYN